MDWMDFLLKFSSELLILAITLTVGGLNWLFFSGNSGKNFQDQSLTSNFISHHIALNEKLYAQNNSIVTVVTESSFLPQAEADYNELSNDDAQDSDNTGDEIVMSNDEGLLAPSPDSIKAAVTNVTKKIYTTQDGDTLQSIAAANNISVNSIIWSNPDLTSTTLKAGWDLVIPPVDGVAVTADANTTLPDLALKYNPQRYNPDSNAREAAAEQLLDTIISYNGLDSAEDINPGDFLIIPGGVIAQAPTPPPAPKTKISGSGNDNSYNNVTSISGGYDADEHYFPVGYCTYYVATKMKITFGGNAKNWLANARASGYVTSKTPATRTAVVFSGYGYGRYGHVAYVESVDSGKILVSEMNYDHFNQVDERWVSTSDPHIQGYIYP
jgi:surface antigen